MNVYVHLLDSHGSHVHEMVLQALTGRVNSRQPRHCTGAFWHYHLIFLIITFHEYVLQIYSRITTLLARVAGMACVACGVAKATDNS